MIQPRTELEAVNTILSMVGETPINSTGVSDLAPGSQALNLLRQVSRSVQSQGWYFNTREDVTLNPDVNGRIIISANTLAIKPSSLTESSFTIRSNYLYDISEETHVFPQSVRASLVVGLEFHELPETFREYITMLAGVRFTSRYSASDLMFRFSESEMREAAARCKAEELRSRRQVFAPRSRRVL